MRLGTSASRVLGGHCSTAKQARSRGSRARIAADRELKEGDILDNRGVWRLGDARAVTEGWQGAIELACHEENLWWHERAFRTAWQRPTALREACGPRMPLSVGSTTDRFFGVRKRSAVSQSGALVTVAWSRAAALPEPQLRGKQHK
jgi:hypothetical protein